MAGRALQCTPPLLRSLLARSGGLEVALCAAGNGLGAAALPALDRLLLRLCPSIPGELGGAAAVCGGWMRVKERTCSLCLLLEAAGIVPCTAACGIRHLPNQDAGGGHPPVAATAAAHRPRPADGCSRTGRPCRHAALPLDRAVHICGLRRGLAGRCLAAAGAGHLCTAGLGSSSCPCVCGYSCIYVAASGAAAWW